jgi:hypothetical protein
MFFSIYCEKLECFDGNYVSEFSFLVEVGFGSRGRFGKVGGFFLAFLLDFLIKNWIFSIFG